MVWSQVSVFPSSSVAVHVLVITLSFGQLPGAVLSVKSIVTLPHPSVKVGLPVLGGSVDSSHSTVRSAEQDITGGRQQTGANPETVAWHSAGLSGSAQAPPGGDCAEIDIL